MLTNRMPATDANDNDRLMAALAYLFTPIVPLIILLVESMKSRPYQKFHAMQSLGFGIIIYVVIFVIGAITCGVGSCLGLLLIIPALYYTYVAYQGAYFEIPWLSKFMMQQGWLQPPSGGGMA